MADLIWIMDVDDDTPEASIVAAQASDFMTGLQSLGIDFQVTVTTTDACRQTIPQAGSEAGRTMPCPGCKINGSAPTIINSSDFNAAADLKSLMEPGDGICGDDEQFFEAAYEAIVNGAGQAYNDYNSVIRPGAYLALITVNGDPEDDRSINTVDSFLNQYLSVKGSDHPELFSWSYINPSQPILPDRIGSMVKLSGGIHLNTDTPNWWKGIFDLWNIILASGKQFALSGTPDPNSIQLYFDGPPPDQVKSGEAPGVLIQANNKNGSWNWRYNAAANTIQVNSQVLTLTATDILYAEYTIVCD